MQQTLIEQRQALEALNPFTFMRKALNYSQEQVASEAGVTLKYIYRQERGLINTPSAAVTEALVGLFDDRDGDTIYYDTLEELRALMLDFDKEGLLPRYPSMGEYDAGYEKEHTLNYLYHEWVILWRAYIKTAVSTIPEFKFTSSYKQVSVLSEEHPFFAFMSNFSVLVGHKVGLNNQVGNRGVSKLLFCRLTAQHPRNYELYVNAARKEMPPELYSALNQCGVTLPQLEELQQTVAAWARRVGRHL